MNTHLSSMDSPQDIATQVRRLSQAMIGQIHRSRGAAPKAVVDIAIGAWGAVATPDYINELATRALAGNDAKSVFAQLQKDALLHLNDFLNVARGDARLIGHARELLVTAVGAVVRHT